MCLDGRLLAIEQVAALPTSYTPHPSTSRLKIKKTASAPKGFDEMIWMTEKKVFHLEYNFGFESVRIPVRVKFEFGVKEGTLVDDTLTKSMLYNKQLLEKQYPEFDHVSLQKSIEKKVDHELQQHLLSCGFIQHETE